MGAEGAKQAAVYGAALSKRQQEMDLQTCPTLFTGVPNTFQSLIVPLFTEVSLLHTMINDSPYTCKELSEKLDIYSMLIRSILVVLPVFVSTDNNTPLIRQGPLSL